MSDRKDNIIDTLEHSNTEEKRAIHQVSEVFKEAGIICGNDKYGKMQENRSDIGNDSHSVHHGTPISHNTYESYKSACVPVAIYVRQEFNVKDLYEIQPSHIASYLQYAIDSEVKYATFDKNCSAISKLCDCIATHNSSKDTDFYKTIESYREFAKVELPQSDYMTRAYDNPQAIIEALPSEKMQVVAELQYTCGLRISDACYISKENWTGSDLTCHSKNGQYITVHPGAELAARISAIVESEGKLSVSRSSYDYQLERACSAVGENFSGSHGFRHNFAQERMEYYTSNGMSYNKALQCVSEEMGHHRSDITKVYLR